MATWTDGAAYAPLERPDGFATPEAEPLEVHPPLLATTPGSIPPPQGFTPSAPQLPLDQVHATPPVTRNPSEPFRTASATLTTGPDAHVPGTRDPLRPFPTYSVQAGTQELPPPTGAPLPPPSGAPLSVAPPPPGLRPQAAPPGTPAPAGTPVWTPPHMPAGPDASTLKTLLGLAAACMALGVVLPGAAPWLVLIGGLLMLRTKSLSGQLGTAAIVAGIVLLLGSLSGAAIFRPLASLTALAIAGAALYLLVRRPPSR